MGDLLGRWLDRDGIEVNHPLNRRAISLDPDDLRKIKKVVLVSGGPYKAEIIRAVLLAVPKGQWEAAYSVGMTWTQCMRRTILPQATRIAVPPLSNTFISLVKDTSLAAAITVPELFRAGQRIVATSYEPLILYVEVALIYLALSSVLSSLQGYLEKRLSRSGGSIEATS